MLPWISFGHNKNGNLNNYLKEALMDQRKKDEQKRNQKKGFEALEKENRKYFLIGDCN